MFLKSWKSIETTDYFLMSDFQIGYEINITDFIRIWYISLSKEQFINILKESNRHIKICEDELIENGKQILAEPMKLEKVDISHENNKLKVFMIKVFGYPLKLNISLLEASKELFFQKVTLLLLRTIDNLKTSQDELRRLLIKKDEEIEEYKCNGGEIVLRHLKTEAFNDKDHMNKYNLLKNVFDCDKISKELLEKNVAVPEQHITIKSEQPEINITEIKVEPESQTSTPTVLTTELISTVKEEKVENNDIKINIRKKRKKINL